MTNNELTTLKDILQWAQQQAKTDGMYIRVKLAREWIDRELKNNGKSE